MPKELSIFCDESGDFGDNSKYYLLSFVLHNQSNSIKEPIAHLQNFLNNSNFNSDCAIHTYPIIRNESEYKHMAKIERVNLLNALVSFLKHCEVKTKTFKIDKAERDKSIALEEELKTSMLDYLDSKLSEINKFDRLIIYYDYGQKQIAKILFDVFTEYFDNVEFRIIKPEDYFLFQVADLTCTLELLDIKYPNMNKNELIFFGSLKRLRRMYLRILYRKRLDK